MNPHVILNGLAVSSPAVDNIIASAVMFGTDGARQFALGLIADYSAAVAAFKTITLKRGATSDAGVLIGGALSIGVAIDEKILVAKVEYAIAKALYTAAAAEVALSAGTIPANKWGIYKVSINAAGTLATTPGAANFTTGYADEATAIAALPATPSGSANLGHVAILTAVGQPFVGGTDALEGGSGGNPSSDTNYYVSTAVGPSTNLFAPIRWDFSKGPLIMPLPGVIHGSYAEGISAELEASGTVGVTGRVTLFGFPQ